MSEEKLDLILTVVTELKGKVDKLDSRMDKLDSRMDNLEKEFRDFKKQINQRIDTLEKQMFAIGTELKEELGREVRGVRGDVIRLEKKMMLEQSEELRYRVIVKELEERVSVLEEKIKLAA